MPLLVIWLICGAIAAMIAASKGSSGCGFAILGFLLGPFGILIALLESGEKCPYCDKSISSNAKVCPHCQRDLTKGS